MENNLSIFLEDKNLTKEMYYQMINIYSRKKVDEFLYHQVLTAFNPVQDLYSNQLEIWEKYGYYLATLKENPYQSLYLEKLNTTKKSSSKNILTKEEEIYYGFHLLKRPYITIFKNNTDNITLDLEKIINSIHSKEMATFFLEKFKTFYQVCTRTSNFDKNFQKTLKLYQEKYLAGAIPTLKDLNLENSSSTKAESNEVLTEEYLKDQIEMYIDYSIATTNYLIYNNSLINRVINQYQNLPDQDILYQEGVFGLINAIENFDIRKCCHFSTYAWTGIKFFILNSVNQDFNLVKIPRNVESIATQIRKLYQKYYKQHGKVISNEELMQCLNIKKEQLNRILLIYKLTLYESLDAIQEKIDLKEKWDLAEKDNYLEEDCPFFSTLPMEEEIIRKIDFQLFFSYLKKTLSEKEKDIILKRAGYNIEKPMSLEEISKDYHVTSERIRQIEGKAIQKILKTKKGASFNPRN